MSLHFHRHTAMRRDDGSEVLLISGFISNRVKRGFYRLNKNTKWISIPIHLVTSGDLWSQSPEGIMATLRRENVKEG